MKRQKIIVFFVGLFTAILLLEVSLRIGGSVYQRSFTHDKKQLIFKQSDNYIILCLGNSYTLGLGAPKGESYPDHLQNLFNTRLKQKNIRVINRGLIYLNSAQLLDRLEVDINDTNPDLIILRTGSPNEIWSNYAKYSKYLEREGKYSSSLRKIIFTFKDNLYRIRVYRLISLLFKNIKDKNDLHRETIQEHFREYYPEYEEAKRVKKLLTAIHAGLYSDQIVSIDEQIIERLIDIFREMTFNDPSNPLYCHILGMLFQFQNNDSEAMRWFIKGIEVKPTFRDDDMNDCFLSLLLLRKHTTDKKVMKSIDEFVNRFKKEYPDDSDFLLYLTEDEIDNWIKSDIREMIRIIQVRGIKLIIQNYPPLSTGKQRRVDGILREIANNLNIPFVDNERLFQEMWDKGKARDYYEKLIGGALGFHLNSEGNEFMANKIYDKIMEEKILEEDDNSK